MDALDLFKKLAAGSKFNIKKFRSDAERFNLVKKQEKPPENKKIVENGKTHSEEQPVAENPLKRKHEEEKEETKNVNTFMLLNGISVPEDGSKIRTKKFKKTMTEEKLRKQEQEKVNHLRNQYRISVTGSQVAKPVTSFEEISSVYQVPENLINNIEKCGYHQPTPIQMQAIPVLLEGRQVLACAPTGSGKTAAFLLPIIHHLDGPQRKGFRAVVLSPTRELAKQTYRECIRLSEGYDYRVHIISKVNQALTQYGPKSSMKFDILITTPKRLVYLLNQDPPAISLENVEWLVVDEADKLFEDGTRCFRDQLEVISKACANTDLRTALFSATNTPVVSKWCRRNLKGLITITIGQRNTVTDLVDQELLFVGNERGKLVAIRNIIQKGMSPPVLVFVQSKERAKELFNELIYDGINVDVIHADRTQTQRDNVVRCFREGKIWVLICTELMGRGIDFKGVNLVINYDFPPSAISYIHRIGRTGRAGHKGKAITFFTQQDTTNLRSIAALMRTSGCEVPDYMLAMKKHSKKEKRILERKAPERESISTRPKFEQWKQKNKRKQRNTLPTDKKSEDSTTEITDSGPLKIVKVKKTIITKEKKTNDKFTKTSPKKRLHKQ